jgi:predicted transcriptional regulator
MMMPNLQAAAVSPNRLPMLTPAQLRAARALVGWSRQDLADASDVSTPAIRDFEAMISDSKQGTVLKWQRALEAAGVAFLNEDDHAGAGVRWKKGWPKTKR